MGRDSARQSAGTHQLDNAVRYFLLIVLALHTSGFVLLLHYSRIMPVLGGRRYLTSTAVFLTEVIKLAICLTVALYDISKSAHPSIPATSLFGSLTDAVFSGDSWKLVIPAGLYTLANSLQYIGLSNLEAATFQVTYQLRLVAAAIFGAVMSGRNLTFARWMSVLLVCAGVAIVQLPASDPYDQDRRAHLHVPRSLEDLKNMGEHQLHKRSATYEGIEEDMMIGNPHLNGNIGLLATVGACIASGLAGATFEKVLKDSSATTSIWIRNVQLAIYSIFPALFIGVVFLDGEKISKVGFFGGYNWVVWTTIGVHAIGGIAASFCISYAESALKNSAGALSVVISSVSSIWLFDFHVGASFLLGTAVVLVAIYVYIHETPPEKGQRPPPIRIESREKPSTSPGAGATGNVVSPPNDFSIKLPTTPLISEAAATTTSRPGSPNVHRPPGRGSYFASQHQES